MVAFRPVCCDTGFLFSLYGNDSFTNRAKVIANQQSQSLAISSFNEFELSNSIRFAMCRGFLPTERGMTMFSNIEADRQAGGFIIAPVSLAATLTEARRLSATHTLTGGHRAMDILHVATALQLEASLFLTFDDHQRTLAQAEGLEVPE